MALRHFATAGGVAILSERLVRTMRDARIGVLAAALLAACGDQKSPSQVTAPGEPASASTRVLQAGATVLQDRPPIEALNVYLDGFHFYNGRPREQMEAHHYCAVLNADVIQCVIFDGSGKDAKLMGVEYVVSAALFATLPESEKPLWHSHVHEVRSGQLIAPGIPDQAERQLMKQLVGTYGKTWHTWHTDREKSLPLGMPQLMMGFTADGQVDPALVTARDQRLRIDSQKKRQDRAGIAAPSIDPGADAWQRGKVIQLPEASGMSHGASAPR